jgi:hypothetical protein
VIGEGTVGVVSAGFEDMMEAAILPQLSRFSATREGSQGVVTGVVPCSRVQCLVCGGADFQRGADSFSRLFLAPHLAPSNTKTLAYVFDLFSQFII